MRAEVLSWCRREALFSPGAQVVCAVSGGADSMAMLCCLRELAAELSVYVRAAHFNHRLRGAESDGDEAFVRAFCAAEGIELVCGAPEKPARSEEEAREQRYAFLDSIPCDAVAIAHTAEDNLETLLQHLLRGSGLRGLGGIPPRRGRYVRPLLAVSHAQARDYLRARGTGWREDATNAEDGCQRNRLRHGVLPLLAAETPELPLRVTELTALVRADDALLDREAERLLLPAPEPLFSDPCVLRRVRLAPLREAPEPLQRRALRILLREALPQDAALVHIRALQALLENPAPAARADLPGRLTVRRSYDALELVRGTPPVFRPVPLAQTVHFPALGLRAVCTLAEKNEKIQNTPFTFALKYDKMVGRIPVFRPRKTGDMLTLPDGRCVTLKKLFLDRRLPQPVRDRVPVLELDGQVIAVVGFGADPRWTARDGEQAVILRIEKEEM